MVSSRFGAATPNLKRVGALLRARTGLPSMAPGTLNLTISCDCIVRPDATIEPDEYFMDERLKLQRCRVRDHRMIIMRPASHEKPGGIGASVLELVNPRHLRTAWALFDGDGLEVEIEGDDAWWARPDPE